MIGVTLEELRYSVLHSDDFNDDLFVSDIDHVLGIAMRKIGFTALEGPLQMDLENGFFLEISVVDKRMGDFPSLAKLAQKQIS